MSKTKPNSDWHWSYNVMLAGLICGFVFIGILGSITVISKLELAKLIAMFCLTGLLIPWKLYFKYLGIDQIAVVLFNLLGIGPLLCILFLLVNLLLGSSFKKETIRIVNKEVYVSDFPQSYLLIFLLENNYLDNYQEFRSYELHEGNKELKEGTRIRYNISHGLFGYDVILNQEVLLN